jgi:tetratricopeptide (TPR) repeat protein
MISKRTPLLSLTVALLLFLCSPLRAAEVARLLEEGEKQLEAWQPAPAEATASRLAARQPRSAPVLDFAARVAFFQGRYEQSVELFEQALAVESQDDRRQALRLLAQQTRDTVKQLKRHESPHFVLFLDEERDAILVPHALDALEKSYEAIGKSLGYYPQGKVRVEIAPDAAAFNAISTLSLRDIEETGAVGICKFNKIMTISPRALIQGYRWLDSLSHEYLHYVIVALSRNQAPIWVHEGTARFLETRWREAAAAGDKQDYLTPANETLLARALEAGTFIGFKKMEPSLIHLETPEEVQLAYAEAASAIDFIVDQADSKGLNEFLTALADAPAPAAIQKVLGIPMEAFEAQWKRFLGRKGLKEIDGARVRRLTVKLGPGQDEGTVELKEIQSEVARNRTHLGDRLWQKKRARAAAAEYRRALQASPNSAIILNKLARVLIELRQHRDALTHLKKAAGLDPDRITTYLNLGQVHHAMKNHKEAKAALEEAMQINPFDPTIYRLMYAIHLAENNPAGARKFQSVLEKLFRRK